MNKKIIVFTVAMVLLLGVTIGATFAYLQDISNTVTNTFTYGNVNITLDEADVDKYGVEVSGADRVTTNEYKLIPAQTYVKDPTVHLAAASEESYLFVKITSTVDDYLIDTDTADNKTLATQMTANGWVLLSTLNGADTLTGIDNVWVYQGDGGTVTGSNLDADTGNNGDIKDYLVFGTITVKDNADVTQITADDQLVINAYAIQADGFDSAVEAWGGINWSQADWS